MPPLVKNLMSFANRNTLRDMASTDKIHTVYTAPLTTVTVCVLFRFCFSLFLFPWRCRFFRVFFVRLPFYLCMKSASYVFSFRIVFFYLVTTGWIFYIILYVCMYVCIFIKLHITAQSDPVILVILCHSH